MLLIASSWGKDAALRLCPQWVETGHTVHPPFGRPFPLGMRGKKALRLLVDTARFAS
jgi:hypothetical protein